MRKRSWGMKTSHLKCSWSKKFMLTSMLEEIRTCLEINCQKVKVEPNSRLLFFLQESPSSVSFNWKEIDYLLKLKRERERVGEEAETDVWQSKYSNWHDFLYYLLLIYIYLLVPYWFLLLKQKAHWTAMQVNPYS